MTRFLLDTNVLSALVRGPRGPIRDKVAEAGGAAGVYTSVIVAAELRFGVAKKRALRLAAQLEVILDEMLVAPFAPPADKVYAALRSDLERAGTPIGANDLLIAAQALHDGSVLVTDNVREFGRVPQLTVENWLRQGRAP